MTDSLMWALLWTWLVVHGYNMEQRHEEIMRTIDECGGAPAAYLEEELEWDA